MVRRWALTPCIFEGSNPSLLTKKGKKSYGFDNININSVWDILWSEMFYNDNLQCLYRLVPHTIEVKNDTIHITSYGNDIRYNNLMCLFNYLVVFLLVYKFSFGIYYLSNLEKTRWIYCLDTL